MEHREIIELFEHRRKELVKAYKQPTSLTKQHQVFGAMKEIDLFLEVLSFYAQSAPEEKKVQPTKGIAKLKYLIEEKLIQD